MATENNKPTLAAAKAVKPTGASLPKANLKQAVNAKQRQQIIMLVVILVILGIALYFFTIKPDTAPLPEEPVIKTDFNTSAVDQVRQRNSQRPEVDLDDLGKSNPFAN